MTVLPVLLAVREFRERYQGGKLSEVAGGLGWLKGASVGGAEAGRGGGGVGTGSDLHDDLRLIEGGESRAGSIIGVEGGVSWGVMGVAGWRTIASLGETSKGVSWLVPCPLLRDLATSSSDMVRVQRQERERVVRCKLIDAEAQEVFFLG